MCTKTVIRLVQKENKITNYPTFVAFIYQTKTGNKSNNVSFTKNRMEPSITKYITE